MILRLSPDETTLRLSLDETALCYLLAGEVLRLSAAGARTGFKRGKERLTLEICLGEELEALRQSLWAALTAQREQIRQEQQS